MDVVYGLGKDSCQTQNQQETFKQPHWQIRKGQRLTFYLQRVHTWRDAQHH